MIFLALLAALLFAAACLAGADSLVQRGHLAAYKRVGAWYEKRVTELENETRQLAEQLVASGAVVRHAMPIPEADPAYDYAYDATGLIRERLDPRDLPIGGVG